MNILRTLILVLAIILMIGCRGDHSTKPPIHLNPNMDSQDKFKAQSVNPFFTDSSAMRLPVEGTIARSQNFGNYEYNSGKDANSNFINNPELLTAELINRGEGRFNIYCAVCHGEKGDGKGNITKYKYPIPPTSFHQDWLIEKKDGYYFDVITNGIRTMPSYKHQISVKDRWAIVSYVRKLQESKK
jgi:mono/diheme cytochrome c family protein